MSNNTWNKKGDKITDGGMSDKKWILPTGEVKEFGSEFHFSYLLNNQN